MDNTQLYISLMAELRLMEVLNGHLKTVIGWERTYKLKLNLDKPVVLLVNGKTTQGLQSQPVWEQIILPQKEQISS